MSLIYAKLTSIVNKISQLFHESLLFTIIFSILNYFEKAWVNSYFKGASAGKGGAHRRGGKGCHRHPDRRADRRCCRHHHQPCLRRGLFAGGPQPRPELKQNSSWDDTLFSCIVLFCADSRPLHGILFQKRR